MEKRRKGDRKSSKGVQSDSKSFDFQFARLHSLSGRPTKEPAGRHALHNRVTP